MQSICGLFSNIRVTTLRKDLVLNNRRLSLDYRWDGRQNVIQDVNFLSEKSWFEFSFSS